MFRLNKLIKLQSIINHADHIFKQTFQMRTLYSLQTLGIDGYLANRERVKLQFNNTTETFKEKMKEFVDEKSTNMIFTEDLKNMVHITEKNADDINLLENMLKKFHSQNKEVRFGNFVFGPVVMRLFYYLQDVESALKLFKDPSLSGIFEQLISYQLLLDLLYEKQRYQDILDTFDLIRDRQLQGGMFPKHVIVLVMGACYKLNTQKSYEYGINLWKVLNDVGHIPMRKATTFLAALALQQNAPHISIEILGTIRQQQYVTVRNLKILSLVKLERAEDTLPILRSVLEVNDAVQITNEQRHSFTKEVIDAVEKAMVNCKNEDSINEFSRLRKFLQEHGHIEENVTLENLLCSEIIQKPLNREHMQRDRNIIAASFRNNNNYNNNNNNNNNSNNNYTGSNSNNTNYNRNNNRQQYSRNTVRNRPGLQDLY